MKYKEVLALIGISITFIFTLPVSLFVLGGLWLLLIEDIEEVIKKDDKKHNR